MGHSWPSHMCAPLHVAMAAVWLPEITPRSSAWAIYSSPLLFTPPGAVILFPPSWSHFCTFNIFFFVYCYVAGCDGVEKLISPFTLIRMIFFSSAQQHFCCFACALLLETENWCKNDMKLPVNICVKAWGWLRCCSKCASKWGECSWWPLSHAFLHSSLIRPEQKPWDPSETLASRGVLANPRPS